MNRLFQNSFFTLLLFLPALSASGVEPHEMGTQAIRCAMKILCLLGERFPEPGPRIGHGTHRPHEINLNDLKPPAIYVLSKVGGTAGPQSAEIVAKYKKQMLVEQFPYEDGLYKLAGQYHEASRIYYVSEGHHRLAAAMEIAAETGDWRYFKRLIANGHWFRTDSHPAKTDRPPLWLRRDFSPPSGKAAAFAADKKALEPPWYLFGY